MTRRRDVTVRKSSLDLVVSSPSIHCSLICTSLIPNLKSFLAPLADPEDFFSPLEDTQSLNTFTKQDHLFARLEFLLQKGTVTLFLQEKSGGTVQESGVIQLEFAGQSPSGG